MPNPVLADTRQRHSGLPGNARNFNLLMESQIMEENGKRYRMLQVGETIEEGDEVNIGKWVIANAVIGKVVRPNEEDENALLPQGYYRRECK